MRQQDLHTHSLFDDGKNTLGQMALAAQAAGLSAIGLSGHSPLPFPNDWAIPEARFGDYLAEARRLREAYREDFRVWVGLEWDTRSPEPPAELDYVIGSVHGLPAFDAGFNVDESAEALRACLDTVYAGDARAMEAAYYAGYDKIAANPRVDIVGHFDLITKYDEPHAVFSAMPDCAVRARKVVEGGRYFEINTARFRARIPARRRIRPSRCCGSCASWRKILPSQRRAQRRVARLRTARRRSPWPGARRSADLSGVWQY